MEHLLTSCDSFVYKNCLEKVGLLVKAIPSSRILNACTAGNILCSFFFFCLVHGEETLNKSCKTHERYENIPLHKVQQQKRSATLRQFMPLHDHQVNELCQFETSDRHAYVTCTPTKQDSLLAITNLQCLQQL